jgi:hypothetical protein
MRLRILVRIALLLGSSCASGVSLDPYSVVKLGYGANRVDFNNDGLEDLVVLARRENFNAHGFDIASFFPNSRRIKTT